MEAQDNWGAAWFMIFAQTRSEVERDAVYALVLTSDDLNRINEIRTEPCRSSPAPAPPQVTNTTNLAYVEDVHSPVRYVGLYYNESMRLTKQLKALEANSQDNSPEFMQLFSELLALHTSHYNYAEANIVLCKTIEAREKKYGENHPFTIILLERAAMWYRHQRKYEDGARIQRRLSHAYKQNLTADHEWGRSPLEQLAFSCYKSTEYAQAEPLYLEVLRRVEASSAHMSIKRPEILRILNRIAHLYAEWKKYSKAEEIYQRLLIMHKADASHEQNPMHLNGLVTLLKMQKKYQKPECFTARLLELYKTTLGPEHPYTLYALNNLADIYKTQLEHEKAEPAYLELLRLQEKIFGRMHLKCIRSLDGLKTVYTRQDDQSKLESVYLRLIERRKQVLGVSHPDTGQNINNLASLYAHQGRDKDAARLYAELVEIYKGGSESSKLKAAQNNLDRLTRKLNGASAVSARKAPASSGYAIPAPPSPPTAKTFALDMDSVQQKIAETAQVQELLQAQFVEEDVAPITSAAAPVVRPVTASASERPAANPFQNLDTPHFVFLNMLLKKHIWARKDVEAVALPLGILANGALERLNEMAFDACDEPLFEGDDPIEVNLTLAKELLA